MCGSMVDIQSATAQIRRGKEEQTTHFKTTATQTAASVLQPDCTKRLDWKGADICRYHGNGIYQHQHISARAEAYLHTMW